MGLLDTILGRTKPVKPNLDALFALPSAAIDAGGLDRAEADRQSARSASSRPKAAAFAGLREQIDELLKADNDKYDETKDSFGFSWITRTGSPDDMSDLVTDLHAVNASLADAGFGPALLCTLVVFQRRDEPAGRPRLPLQARHLVPVRADRPGPAATTRASSR